MREPSSHADTFVRDNMTGPELWPEMDYSVLPELAAYPARFNVASELIDGQADERPAILFGNETWTYAGLAERANRIAAVLVEDCGLVPGERVLLRSGNHPMLVASWLGTLKAGGIAVATMPVLRERELVYMIGKAKIRIAISSADLADELEKASNSAPGLDRILRFGNGLEAAMEGKSGRFDAVDTAADDPAIIGFTSGSTGTPKATVHFHRDILAAADCFAGHVVKIRPGDIVCGSPQIAFLYGLCAFVPDTFRFGATVALLERGTPKAVLQAIEKYRATICFSTPSGYRMMLETARGHDLSSLRECVAGGEPLPPATFHEWKEITGVGLINGLGISELLHIFISASGGDIKPGAIGKAVPGFQVRIVDEDMNDAPSGAIGQMIAKGPNGCRYLGDSDRQAAYVRDGWNMSGDLCRIDAEGYVHYEARTDDMILTGGYNVSGLEVEAVLLEHPKVREVAVVGSPDADRGEIVKAFVVPSDSSAACDGTISELQDFVKSQISAFKYPRAVEFVDELPLTVTGKIRRGALRQLERERAADAS